MSLLLKRRKINKDPQRLGITKTNPDLKKENFREEVEKEITIDFILEVT